MYDVSEETVMQGWCYALMYDVSDLSVMDDLNDVIDERWIPVAVTLGSTSEPDVDASVMCHWDPPLTLGSTFDEVKLSVKGES